MNNLLGKKHTEDKIPSDIFGGATSGAKTEK